MRVRWRSAKPIAGIDGVQRSIMRVLLGKALFAWLLLVGTANAYDATYDVENSWKAALVVMPGAGDEPIITRMHEAMAYNYFAPVKKGTPVVLYLHGSTGIKGGHLHDMKNIARAGLIAIGPDSFKRKGRKEQCDENMKCGGFPDAHKWRIEEIRYALKMLPAFIMG